LRGSEVLGSATAIILAVVVFYVFASNPPAYRYWIPGSVTRLIKPDFIALSQQISGYLWGPFFPILVAFGLVLLTLALGLSALLRREE